MGKPISVGAANLSDADRKAIVEAYEAGEFCYVIGNRFGVSAAFVTTLAKAHGLGRQRKSKAPTQAEIDKMIELFREGKTKKDIGAALGFRPERVSGILAVNGFGVVGRGYTRRMKPETKEETDPAPVLDSVLPCGETVREKVTRLASRPQRLSAQRIAPLVGLPYAAVQAIIDGVST